MIISMLCMGFLAFFQQAHAGIVIQTAVCDDTGGCFASPARLVTTSAVTAGDMIVVAVRTGTAPTDNQSNTYTQVGTKVGNGATVTIFATTTSAGGHLQVTTINNGGILLWDTQSYSAAGATCSSGTGGAMAASFTASVTSYTTTGLTVNAITMVGLGGAGEGITPTATYTALYIGGGTGTTGIVGQYNAAASGASTLSATVTNNGGGTGWADLACSFPNSTEQTTTSTTTVVTTVTSGQTVTTALLQVGGIPANSSSVSLVSKTPEMIYVQNPVASVATLVNMTLKLAATDITSSTATLYLGIYQQNTPNQVPSASYPMQLQSPTISYSIANGTTGFIHVPISQIQANGPITVCGFCYWGIGIWTNGNHSSGATNSGVYLYQATVANTVGGSAPTDALCGVGFGHPGYPWNYLPNQATSVGLPANWYFIGCSLQKNLAFVAFDSYGVAIVYAGSVTNTVTTVQTTTLSTATTTVTTTANQASQTVIQGANFYLAMTLIVGIFMVGLWAGGLGGGMLGAIIGEIAAIAAGVFTPGQATLILVSTLIGCAAAFALGQGQRGRGFGL